MSNKKEDSKFVREIKSWAVVILIAIGLKSTVVEAYQIPTGSMEKTVLIGDFILGKKFTFGTRTPSWIGIPFTRMGFDIPYFRLPRYRSPQSGDIIIFKYPLDTHLNYIKRCIGGPGQTVEIIEGQAYVDGKIFENPAHSQFTDRILPENYREKDIFPPGAGNRDNYGPIYVPAKGDTLRYGEDNVYLIQNAVKLAGHTFRVKFNKMVIDGRESDYYVVEQDHYFMMGDNRHNSSDSRYWGFVPFDYIMGNPLITYLSWNKGTRLYKLHKIIRWNRIGNIPK